MSLTATTFDHGVPWEDDYGYRQAVRVGDTIHVSGQLAHDAAGNLVGDGDVAAQCRATFDNIDLVLAHFGATRSQIVDELVLVVGLWEHFATVAAAHRTYYGTHRPASTAMGVVELALPGQLLEIAVTVRLDLEP